eukprot:755207-Hanusia_phi.AAC.7
MPRGSTCSPRRLCAWQVRLCAGREERLPAVIELHDDDGRGPAVALGVERLVGEAVPRRRVQDRVVVDPPVHSVDRLKAQLRARKKLMSSARTCPIHRSSALTPSPANSMRAVTVTLSDMAALHPPHSPSKV